MQCRHCHSAAYWADTETKKELNWFRYQERPISISLSLHRCSLIVLHELRLTRKQKIEPRCSTSFNDSQNACCCLNYNYYAIRFLLFFRLKALDARKKRYGIPHSQFSCALNFSQKILQYSALIVLKSMQCLGSKVYEKERLIHCTDKDKKGTFRDQAAVQMNRLGPLKKLRPLLSSN